MSESPRSCPLSDARNHVSFIWNIAESLRGPFKPSEYGSVVLPITVLARLDAVLGGGRMVNSKLSAATAPAVDRFTKR